MGKRDISGFLVFVALKLVCCGAIILLVLGGTGLLSGITTRNIILVFFGGGVMIYGVYVYFRRRGVRYTLK